MSVHRDHPGIIYSPESHNSVKCGRGHPAFYSQEVQRGELWIQLQTAVKCLLPVCCFTCAVSRGIHIWREAGVLPLESIWCMGNLLWVEWQGALSGVSILWFSPQQSLPPLVSRGKQWRRTFWSPGLGSPYFAWSEPLQSSRQVIVTAIYRTPTMCHNYYNIYYF